MPLLKAAELSKHPGFTHLEWDLPPTKQGRCEVAKKRSGGPFSLYYEVHGTGPVKLVLIMGLGAFLKNWKRQTRYFGHQRSSEYSVLIFDNRGMGLSDVPTSRYSTSEMAKDTLDLLVEIGWLNQSNEGADAPQKTRRDLNIVGVSMGGMIAQELAMLIPESIQSLILVSTAPRIERTVPFLENLRQRINMFVPRDIDVQLDEVGRRLYSETWLAQPDTEYKQHMEYNFPTNHDRVAAGELSKRMDPVHFTRKGFILQAAAAGWHSKSTKQLQKLGDDVGRSRIAVLHGTNDRMITYHHATLFEKDLKPIDAQQGSITHVAYEGVGHVLLWEIENEFNKFVVDFVAKTSRLA